MTLGDALRGVGLTPRALAAWAGTDRVSLLPPRIEELAATDPMPAAIGLSIFVAGREVEVDRVRLPTEAIDHLVASSLATIDHGRLRAEVAILPVGPSLVVCDRLDAPPTAEKVCWPDDSSYHLAGAIPPGRVARWLDLGCGSAFAPLVHPERATTIVGVELNPMAIDLAHRGAWLSNISHLELEHGDLAIDIAPAELVTCNAPMPSRSEHDGLEMWRYTDDDLFERLWRVLADRVLPGGLAIVHAAISAIPYERLAGERIIVVYTPPDVAPAFGVLWWRPDAPDRLAMSHRALTPERPHLDAADR